MGALAFHITWGTYGTQLHGDPRKTVDRKHNERGTPYLKYDEHRWEASKERLKYPRIVLTREQMVFVEGVIPGVCERGHWKLHACAAGPDHVHVVLSTKFDRDVARRLLKRWVGQEMSGRRDFGGGEDRTWWAECGSVRPIEDEAYFAITGK